MAGIHDSPSCCPLAKDWRFMVQNNRQLIRLFFLLVISIGLFGGWWTSRRFQIESFTLSPATDTTDWVDLLALIGEQTIQLFLGLTSGQ